MVREALSEKMTFDQKPEHSEGTSFVNIWERLSEAGRNLRWDIPGYIGIGAGDQNGCGI